MSELAISPLGAARTDGRWLPVEVAGSRRAVTLFEWIFMLRHGGSLVSTPYTADFLVPFKGQEEIA